ncbi:glycerol uptake facilitator-like aquaporin [Dokdonella fugitiva]|uniref:Glycerol uptake facilitator-like aquaporin n=1 Tax=Dokdonella fugitiva TaxID=328517 RepID=A0A839F5B4_9GAMM|nr:aquaporin [Dokdonella fugitiva]MBA8888728.1 glycerol uptake facilitator-like aquaporin [Dokdonella fugitiva]
MTRLRGRLVAEFVATAVLLCAVIGSGIMGERLAGGNAAIALLANTGATIAILYVLIEIAGPISGAHMNPLVTAALAVRGHHERREIAPYLIAQAAGATAGAWLANAMFDLRVLQWSAHARTGLGLWLGEAVATAGLLLVVLRAPKEKVAALVAAYIGAAYWFTSSTSFANPAATFGRMFSDSFAGIAPQSVPMFVVAEVFGAGVAVWAARKTAL